MIRSLLVLSCVPLSCASSRIQAIPFTLTSANNISIPAVLNETDAVDLMFHTASGAVFLTKVAMERVTSVKMDQKSAVTSWGGTASTRFSSGNRLRIGDRTWSEVAITEDKNSGHQTDGKFGPHLFRDQILEIDFERCVLTVHPRMPILDEGYESFELEVQRGGLFLKGRVRVDGQEYSKSFLVHSGFSGTILLDDAFVRSQALGAKLETLGERELRDSMGNVLKTKRVRLDGLRFGSFKFASLPIGIFEGAISKQTMSVLGGELLKRFHVVLDVKGRRIYLKPNRLFESEFERARPS